MRFLILLFLSFSFVLGVPAFALTVTQNPDIAAGRAAFGPAGTLFNWVDSFPAATTWSFGTLPPNIQTGSATDPITGNTVTGNVHLGNWIDGDGFNPSGVGFNSPNGSAAPDLAIDGVENFVLHFTSPVSTLGFAAATGTGNLPHEFDHLGTVFELTTNTGEPGTLALSDSGGGYAAWVTISASVPFTTLTFSEPSNNIEDQYFGNIFTAVPEPQLSLLLFIGLGVLTFCLRTPAGIAGP